MRFASLCLFVFPVLVVTSARADTTVHFCDLPAATVGHIETLNPDTAELHRVLNSTALHYDFERRELSTRQGPLLGDALTQAVALACSANAAQRELGFGMIHDAIDAFSGPATLHQIHDALEVVLALVTR